jgi:hypothetical protein
MQAYAKLVHELPAMRRMYYYQSSFWVNFFPGEDFVYLYDELSSPGKISSGSVEYNVMATKMAPCTAAIFRTHHDIPRGHAERTARAGRKILVFPMIVRAGFQVDRLGAGPR